MDKLVEDTEMTTRAREVAQLTDETKDLLANLNAVPFAHEYRMEGETFGQIVDVLRRLLDECEALLAEREWRSIDSAPRDWTDVLVFSPKHEGFNCGGVFSAFYDDENGQWLTHGPAMNMEISPTHWFPLPQPPEGEG